MEVDGPPRVPLEAGVEEALGVGQGCSLGEGHLHALLVGLARADQPVVRPDGDLPLPLLDDLGIRFPDQGAQAGEQVAPPVGQLLDAPVDHLRSRVIARGAALLHRASLLRAGARATAIARCRAF